MRFSPRCCGFSFSSNSSKPNLHKPSHRHSSTLQWRLFWLARKLLWLYTPTAILRKQPLHSTPSTHHKQHHSSTSTLHALHTLRTIPKRIRLRQWIWLWTMYGRMVNNQLFYKKHPFINNLQRDKVHKNITRLDRKTVFHLKTVWVKSFFKDFHLSLTNPVEVKE